MILAAICGGLLLLAFLAFFYNIVMTVGLKGVIGIFSPTKDRTTDLIRVSKVPVKEADLEEVNAVN